MTPLFKKLNLGEHRDIVVLKAPGSFDSELAQLEGVAVRRKATGDLAFVIAFVQTLADVESCANWLPKLAGDGIVWLCYPKQTSKTYTCEFNRDTGWEALGQAGFEPVRQVAIDADWSALRFRRVEHIKTLTRRETMAISDEGKARTKKKASK